MSNPIVVVDVVVDVAVAPLPQVLININKTATSLGCAKLSIIYCVNSSRSKLEVCPAM